METNVEEGIAGIGGLLFLIIALFIIAAIAAAWYSGYLDGFFKGIKDAIVCIKGVKGDPLALIECITRAFFSLFGIKL